MHDGKGLTRSLADFVADLRARDVPEAAVATATAGFLDCVAVIALGWETDVARHLRRIDGLAGWSDPFGRAGANPATRALHLAVAAHALDFDDTAIAGHPSAVLVPAILAELHDRPHSGADAIAAWIAGYEVWGELAAREPDPLHGAGWHPSAVYGPVAAAAAVASLRRCDAATTATALSLAASTSGGLIAQFGTWAKPWQLGRAAKHGHEAATIAVAGMMAAPTALEHPLGLLAALSPGNRARLDGPRADGLHVLTEGLNIKLYPVCYAMHRALDATGAVVAAHDVNPDAVAGVTVEIGETQAGLLRHARPGTASEARFSLHFGVASMLLRRRCGPEELDEKFIRSDGIRALCERVEVRTLSERSPLEPAHSPWDRVTLHLRDGRSIQSDKIDFPVGHFRNPAPAVRLAAKFDACTTGLPRDRAARLRQALEGLASLPDTDILFLVREVAHAE